MINEDGIYGGTWDVESITVPVFCCTTVYIVLMISLFFSLSLLLCLIFCNW